MMWLSALRYFYLVSSRQALSGLRWEAVLHMQRCVCVRDNRIIAIITKVYLLPQDSRGHCHFNSCLHYRNYYDIHENIPIIRLLLFVIYKEEKNCIYT